MKHLILGTAGHVDHGKTSLIKALTGIDTDRLKEEKERGITIELGFASMLLPGGCKIGIVDVPGHEKFVKNMVAGAGGIDLVALVIAADEGIMPQTREHLEICTLLGIQTGLVALTKTDLVDKEWLDLVSEDIREFLKNTFLKEAPIIPVSAVTGSGLPQFVSTLDKIISGIDKQSDSGHLRLPVDRVFTMKGFGTVVTGTLISGRASTGDTVEVLPGKLNAKIRGIQVHNEPAESAEAGQRTAINLQGVERDAVERGNLLTHPGIFEPTLRIDASFQLLLSAPRKLKSRSLVRFHSGTMEIMSRIILLDRDELLPGESALAQIVFETPGVNMAGDRFVVRSYSPVRTIGGGSVLDPLPRKHKRFAQDTLAQMEMLLKGSDMERVLVIIDRGGLTGVDFNRISIRAGIAVEKLQPLLDKLQSVGGTILLDGEERRFASSTLYRSLQSSVLQDVRSYQERFPLKTGISKEELKSSQTAGLDPRLFQLVLRNLERNGKLLSEKEIIRTPDHTVNLKGELEDLRQKIEKIFLDAKLTPPSIKDLAGLLGGNSSMPNILNVMLKEGVLLKVTEDIYFHRDALDRLKEDYRQMLLREGKSTPTNFKELTGLSRKYIIPLMEYFDKIKVTIRVGDHRILRREEK
jgi:selenocysteine-specific elongation factor